MFFALLGGGLVFLALLLYFTGNIDLQKAVYKVLRRLGKTGALRQLAGILGAMVFVRYGLEPLIKNIRVIMKAQGSWEKSSEFYILREVGAAAAFVLRCCLFVATSHSLMLACSCAVQWPKKRGLCFAAGLVPQGLAGSRCAACICSLQCQRVQHPPRPTFVPSSDCSPPLPPLLAQLYKPLEFLFLVAAFTTLAENFLPQLMSLPKSIVQTVVRSTLSLTFVIAAARVVFNIKGR
jgi:hypothetical protein